MTLDSQIKSIASNQATLQSQVQSLKTEVDSIKQETIPAWPVITKYSFRQLLTQEQILLWDNWQEMDLGLTQEEKWQMNSFFKSFDSAEKVTMTDPMMQAGMAFFVAKGLLTQDEADRILAGQAPVEPEEE